MRTEYIAKDGKRFSDKLECLRYENEIKGEREREIQQEMKEVGEKLWRKYHPEYEGGDEPKLEMAADYLKADICALLCDFPKSEPDIVATIKELPHGDVILKCYIDMEQIQKKAAIRRDFDSALRSVKDGTELSGILDWSFREKDIAELARLHKARKHRKKIEELLTDCNFHYECGKLIAGEYEEFLKEEGTCN